MSDLIKTRINGLQVRSKSMRLKELMPDIDRRVSEGVSHGDIISALAEEGLVVSMATFRTNLYRYRKDIKGGKPEPEIAGQGGEISIEPPRQEVMRLAITTSDEDFEAAMDPSRRNELAGQYVNSRKPILGKKKQRIEDQ